MANPVPVFETPAGTDPTQLYQLKMDFSLGRWTWDEKFLAIFTTPSTNPLKDMLGVVAPLIAARLSFLSISASLESASMSYQGKVGGTGKSFNPGGYLPGLVDGQNSLGQSVPVWIGAQVLWSSPGATVKSMGFYRGITTTDDTWAAGEIPTVGVGLNEGLAAMSAVLGVESDAQPNGGIMKWVIPSNTFLPGTSNPPLPLAGLGVNASNQMNFTFLSAIQKGTIGAPVPIGAGDYFRIHGQRAQCSKGLMGKYRVVSVSTDEDTGQVTYQTSKPLICNPSAGASFTAYGWAVIAAYFQYGQYEFDKIRKRDTGVRGAGGTRGRSPVNAGS